MRVEMVRLGIDEEQPLAVQQWYLLSPEFSFIPFASFHLGPSPVS
jgi:hypothetical protein